MGEFRLRNGYIFILNDDKEIGGAVFRMLGSCEADRRAEFLDLLVKLSLSLFTFLAGKAINDRTSASECERGRARERARE